MILKISVADPDPSDPYVFGPPGSGSGSIIQMYGSGSGSGSGSFYHQAKIVRKLRFFVGVLKVNEEKSRIRIRNH
jgi:hypothetical protein